MSLVMQTCWNDPSLNLYVVPFISHVITILDKWMKFEIGVSADWYIIIEH